MPPRGLLCRSLCAKHRITFGVDGLGGGGGFDGPREEKRGGVLRKRAFKESELDARVVWGTSLM